MSDENKSISVYQEGDKLIILLCEKNGKGQGTIEVRDFSFPMPFSTREGSYLKSFTGRYHKKGSKE